ncbi:MAG: hypothetical protein ACLFV7_15265 [Phycisphaerae bacterium]
MSPTGEVLHRRHDETFDLLQTAVETLDDAQWRQGNPPYDGPARATLHALQAAEFYTHQCHEVFRWQGKGVWEMSPEELPSRQQMLDYLGRVRQLAGEWIAHLDERDIAPAGGGAGQAVDAIVYAICHLQHHTGEVCAWMKQFGHPQEKWV